jgi:hypothetical protein
MAMSKMPPAKKRAQAKIEVLFPGMNEDPKYIAAADVYCRLHQCLPLAALACILRPTNILVWATLGSVAWLRTSWAQRRILVGEVIVCG